MRALSETEVHTKAAEIASRERISVEKLSHKEIVALIIRARRELQHGKDLNPDLCLICGDTGPDIYSLAFKSKVHGACHAAVFDEDN